ncbi:hypothetical protein L3i22_058900 [Actinoplanes sp. L3-i22]|nr:hypothetical protein L3i22_058900 [Actinoplanes sp. L3-i22]
MGKTLTPRRIIGERLYVSPLTVKSHVNRAMMKLGARDRAQLVVIAYQSGPGPPGRGGAALITPGRQRCPACQIKPAARACIRASVRPAAPIRVYTWRSSRNIIRSE